MKNLNFQKGISSIIAVIVLAIILIGGGAYYFKQQAKPASKPVAVDATTNWKTYKNIKYGFSFKYPPNLLVNEEENEMIDYISIANFPIKDLAFPGNSKGKKDPSDPDVFYMAISYDRRFQVDLQTVRDYYKDTNLLHFAFSDYSVGNKPGFKVVYEPTPFDKQGQYEVITIHNRFKLSFFSPLSRLPQYNQTFDQILSTFKFTQ